MGVGWFGLSWVLSASSSHSAIGACNRRFPGRPARDGRKIHVRPRAARRIDAVPQDALSTLVNPPG